MTNQLPPRFERFSHLELSLLEKGISLYMSSQPHTLKQIPQNMLEEIRAAKQEIEHEWKEKMR